MHECEVVTWNDGHYPADLNAQIRQGHTVVGYSVINTEYGIVHNALVLRPAS